MKAIKSDNPFRKMVNENFIIRLDGHKGQTIEIHSAVGYELAVTYCGETKFKQIIKKALKKGGDITSYKPNHKLTITLYSR